MIWLYTTDLVAVQPDNIWSTARPLGPLNSQVVVLMSLEGFWDAITPDSSVKTSYNQISSLDTGSDPCSQNECTLRRQVEDKSIL